MKVGVFGDVIWLHKVVLHCVCGCRDGPKRLPAKCLVPVTHSVVASHSVVS